MNNTDPAAPVLLVNANLLQPVVAPLGLEYVAAALREQGLPLVLVDLAAEGNPESALARALGEREYALIGVTVRNTDDCYFKSGEFLLPAVRELIARVRAGSAAPVVIGGVGYSVFPREALDYLAADFGIAGDGEDALAALYRARGEQDLSRVPGLVWRSRGGVRQNPPARRALRGRPAVRRDLVDHRYYLRAGAMVGFETKRGCSQVCVYCADPVAKGRRVRARDPRAVAVELAGLVDRGADVLHTCDSEFNVPPAHAAAVCREIIRRGLGERIRWYAYGTPLGFTPALAALMRRAGCVGINFGVDSGDPGMLGRLGRRHGPGEIQAAVCAAKAAGLIVICDLLIGGPGEDRRSVAATIRLMKTIDPHRVGLALGLRLYPGTPLAANLGRLPRKGFHPPRCGSLFTPSFFLSPDLGPDPERLVLDEVRGDERFFTAGLGEEKQDYNYSGHALLVQAIRDGHRGAFWDILRRLQQQAPPLVSSRP